MKILVVAAHPDDETLGMGGTLKKLSKHHQIKVMFLADGISGRRKSGYQNIPTWETSEKEKKKMDKEKLIRVFNVYKKDITKYCEIIDIAETGGSKLSPKKATAKSTEKKIKVESKAKTETQPKVVEEKVKKRS